MSQGALAGSRAGRTKQKKQNKKTNIFQDFGRGVPGAFKKIVFVVSKFFQFGTSGAGRQQGSKLFVFISPFGEASGGTSGGFSCGGIFEVTKRISNGFREDVGSIVRGLQRI